MPEGLDLQGLEQFGKDLLRTGETYRKKEKKFLQREGSKLRKKVKAKAKAVRKKTGNYYKSIKRGKVYSYRGEQAVRVYSAAPHAHLIEDGHRMVTHEGREVGFVRGHHIFEVARDAFEPQFLMDLDDFLEGVLKF